MKIFALSNSVELANRMSNNLSESETNKFSDGEIKVVIKESVRGKKVLILGSLCSSDDIIELTMMVDAAKRASAKEVVALVPYLGYMRQDRKDEPRTSIGAKVIAKIIESSGVDQLITLDLHATQIEGFFNIPVTHLTGESVFVPYIKSNFDLSEYMIVSPDVGGAKRAKKFAHSLNLPLAIINKEREMANQVSSMELIGDVTNKNVIIVDDMVDTAGSLCKAVDTLLENGANKVSAFITHGVLSGPALDRISKSKIDQLYVSDSINVKNSDKITVITSSNIFSNTLNIIKKKQSVSHMLSVN